MARPEERVPKFVADVYYVYNVSKQAFINLNVRRVQTRLERLRGLLGTVRLASGEGLWVVPAWGAHTIGVFYSIDLIYLDSSMRVLKVVEGLKPFHIAPLMWQSGSILELPAHSVYESGTQVGDQLLICTQEEMERYWERQRVERTPPPIPIKRAKAV